MTDVMENAIEAPTEARARPRESDDAVQSEAAAAFAKMAVARHADLLDGATEDEFRDDLLSVLPIWDHDGMELAQAMSRRYGYPLDSALVELMAGWSGYLSDGHRKHVSAWVLETKPVAPFERVARVAFEDRGSREPRHGTAYRSPRGDVTAVCYVVPDAERDRFMRNEAFAGGVMLPWEAVTVTGPGRACDIAAYEAMHSEEARQAKGRAYMSFAHGRTREFDGLVAQATSELAGWTQDRIRAGLEGSAAELAKALSAPGFDPASPAVAALVAGLSALRSRVTRDAFEALPPSD